MIIDLVCNIQREEFYFLRSGDTCES